MEIHIIKNNDGRINCSTDIDKAAWDKIPCGTQFAITIRRPRNPKFHRMTWALITLLADNWPGEVAITPEQAMRWLKLKTGHCQVEKDIESGEDVVIPLSTAFDSMSQNAYEEWWSNAVLSVSEKLGIEVEDLSDRLDDVNEWGKCQNPECSNKATDRHHIFGGTFMRSRSEKLGYIVKICRKCHELAEKSNTMLYGYNLMPMTAIEYYRRTYCNIIGVNYNEALKKINQEGKASRIYKLK